MTSWIAVVIALFAVSQNAYALRGTIPGSSCDSVAEAEAKLGGVPSGKSEMPEGDFTLFFKEDSEGRTVLISYHCVSDRVDRQLISMKFDSEQEAHIAFSDWHRDLVAEFGTPSRDIDEPTASEISAAAGTTTRRLTVWDVNHRVISLALLFGSEHAWKVLVAGP